MMMIYLIADVTKEEAGLETRSSAYAFRFSLVALPALLSRI
jgi:hypothetical protein